MWTAVEETNMEAIFAVWRTGFEPMTLAIPVQRSTNWANNPTASVQDGSKQTCETFEMVPSWLVSSVGRALVIKLVPNKPMKWWINDCKYMKIIYVNRSRRNEYRSDPRSCKHYLSSSENRAWKRFRHVQDLNLWPLRYRCTALPTELTSQLPVFQLVPNKPVKWLPVGSIAQ